MLSDIVGEENNTVARRGELYSKKQSNKTFIPDCFMLVSLVSHVAAEEGRGGQDVGGEEAGGPAMRGGSSPLHLAPHVFLYPAGGFHGPALPGVCPQGGSGVRESCHLPTRSDSGRRGEGSRHLLHPALH